MKKLLVAMALAVALSACQTAPQAYAPAPVVTQVDKAVAVPCKVSPVDKPAFAVDSLALGADIYTQVKTLLADRAQRKGYEAKLEAAVQSCQ
ncbi:TPA: hypothetical protein ACU967_002217 [Burkholderia contaminans]|uniref:hypothetical protein n=1 Tax=Burkholderia contaminans TaxID=488447 RepID=UPI000D00A28B|nr:hypothetical protein [Burkholderia contaminans]HDR9065460.1 hypothetical protein [Burkholderia vietnamiensis]MBM6427899.1 hypothetical protein [Burkholderia contaminans]MCA7876730.1 hypothetical protein [Burkholderia contaminans]MDN8024247.1 hypothetical protein [Burkholderia contaminans]PRG14349.1 hypothetical protein C6Q17_08755 [Burkholderia contaminans]